MTGILYIVATPLGHLGDFSPRAEATLREVDYVLAEDTRVTLKLLQHFGVSKRLISYSEHSSLTKDQVIIDNLKNGESYALVSDAGTPAVSDPGARLVGLAVKEGITVLPVPGPSSVTALVSIFGMPSPSFHFWGFFPQKKKKQTELVQRFRDIDGIHVFFESPFRVVKTFESCLLELEDFHIVVGREMTKKFESYYRGTPTQVLDRIKEDPIKGEFVIGLRST